MTEFQTVAAAVDAYIDAETYAQKRQLVKENAELLLSDTASQLLERKKEDKALDKTARNELALLHQMLWSCGHFGIDEAFDQREQLLEFAAAFAKRIAELGESAQQQLTDPEGIKTILKQVAVEQDWPLTADTQSAREALDRLFTADSPEHYQQLLRDDADLLLSDAAQTVLDHLNEHHRDEPEVIDALQSHRRVLITARQNGLDAALDLIHSSHNDADA